MLRNRLIFGLIHSDGFFMQSRNFRLQRVGNLDWLNNNYKLQETSFSVDELLIVDASRQIKDVRKFSEIVGSISEQVFIPIAAGGGIKSVADAEILFNNGADKLVINSALKLYPDIVRTIVAKYGSQSVIASVDYKLIDQTPVVFIENGSCPLSDTLLEYLAFVRDLGVGEILLNSIDQDGTGFGYDIQTISEYATTVKIPFIAMGGAGNAMHFKDALNLQTVDSVATANLFNFIGNGLPLARQELISCSYNLARWEND